MDCPACQSANRPGATRCKSCEATLPPSCFGCGAPVPADQELCAACRTERLPEEAVEEVPVARRALGARLIGRKAPLEKLRTALSGTRQRELSFVTLVGPGGIGKTRLAQELIRLSAHATPELRVLSGLCGGHAAPPYAGVARLLASRFGIAEGDTPRAARQKIAEAAEAVLGDKPGLEVSHLIGELCRLPFPDSPVVAPLAERPAQLEARMFIAVRRFLVADAQRSPLLLVFDDVDRAGAETINLIHYLAAGLASAPVMMLCVARPSLFDAYPAFGRGDYHAERIELGPLSPDEAAALLGELVPGEPPARLAAHARGLGNPRAVTDLVRLLGEAGVIAPEGSIDAAALEQIELPDTHEEILAARLQRLPPTERSLLEKAAACGETFWLDAIVALARSALVAEEGSGDPDGPTLGEIAAEGDRSRDDAGAMLETLAGRGLVIESARASIPGEREYCFAYAPLRDLVYEGIEPQARRGHHRLLAQWLELRPEGRGEEAQEEVARHLERAGEPDQAAMRYRRGGDAARARYYNDKAIRLYTSALETAGPQNLALRIHLWHDLGSVYGLKGDYDAALAAFEHMLRLAWVVASRSKGAVAFNKMGRVWRERGDLNLSLEYLERGLELFQQAGDHRGVAGSLDDIGQTLWGMGRYDQALERAQRALEARRRIGDRRSIAASLANLGRIEKDRGRFDEAERCLAEAIAMRSQAGDRVGEVEAEKDLGIVFAARGDLDAARREWDRALRSAEEIGALPLQAMLLDDLGEIAMWQGNLAEARRQLERARELAKEVEDRRLQSDVLRNLGLLELKAGHAREARDLCGQAFRIAAESKLRDYEGRALLALGEVHAETLFDDTGKGGAEMAEDFLRRGVELFRQLGNDTELARGLERYGRFRIERGDPARGKELLVEASALFERLGLGGAESLRSMIAELV